MARAAGRDLGASSFDARVCSACSLRLQCIASKKGKGRTVSLHPQEALLQQARLFQKSEAFAGYRKRRQVAEHRLARLVQLGIRQARYFGRVKTLFQLLLAAAVANLTLVAARMGMMGKATQQVTSFFAALYCGVLTVATALVALHRLTLVLMTPLRSIKEPALANRGYRPDF